MLAYKDRSQVRVGVVLGALLRAVHVDESRGSQRNFRFLKQMTHECQRTPEECLQEGEGVTSVTIRKLVLSSPISREGAKDSCVWKSPDSLRRGPPIPPTRILWANNHGDYKYIYQEPDTLRTQHSRRGPAWNGSS